MLQSCPLCSSSNLDNYHQDKRREYRFCHDCHLVFVPKQFHLDEREERKVYDLHENSLEDPAYRRFLSRLSRPLLEHLGENKKGLDFGCGSGPALAAMLEEKGHRISLYDIFYFDNKEVLHNKYDFICATEVFEHLRHPAEEINRLFSMLKRGGWLAIMTKLVLNKEAFIHWHYIHDLTHICFYSKETFQFLSAQNDCALSFIDKDVVFLRKHHPED